MGRLVPIKGVEDAIRAAALDGKTTLVIAGAGPERPSLEACARASETNARFVGVVTGSEKQELFRAADVFVLSSRPTARGREEGVPTALLEAMASGLPVIATDTGGVSSIVKDGVNGRLVRAGDEAALGRALTELRTDEKLRRRLGRQAKKTGSSYFWSDIAPRIEALLSANP
jgi:glycosyltransferase involved in cell wall biosynthesis